MSASDNLQISIRDFRAIQKADISLNGITVLAGVNGCGKSTISRLVYVLMKRMLNYSDLVLQYTSASLKLYLGVLENFLLTYTHDYRTFSRFSSVFQLGKWSDLEQLNDKVASLCQIILEQRQTAYDGAQPDEDRERRMLINTINGSDNLSFEDALRELRSIIAMHVSRAQDQVKSRPISILNDSLERSFSEAVSKKVSLTEYGDVIYSDKKSSVPIPHFVDQQFYIDTPFELDNNYYEYWIDLNKALKQSESTEDSAIASIIGTGIVKGNARYEKTKNETGFYFKDSKGKEFDLALAATGIKSFSIIQMLLRGGRINENTLLILDEPEAHLHPQWIIEYARIIVLIHKQIGAKFLISSHSPDMVSAIKYIAEAESCTNTLEFYSARRAQDGSGRFNFRSTGLDIDPIFKSFNKSYERLEKYVGDYENEESKP